MKSIKLMAAALALMIFASACPVPLPRAIIKPNSSARNEVIVTPELKALLEETPRPKLVIRVSNPPSNVTEAEKFNAYINLIEKTMMQNGFTVRDRALLENLMRSGNADYKTIGEKIDTDIILDILSLQFDIPNRLAAYLNLTTNQNETFRFPDNFVDCQLAKLECRLTIVTKGQLGGMFTFYASRCDVQDLEFMVNSRNGTMMWANSQTPQNETKLGAYSQAQMYRDLAVPIDTEQIKSYFVTYLARDLMNQLLESINSRLKASKKLYDEGRYSEAQEIISYLIKKDPDNFMPYLHQALIYAQQGDFSKAQLELEKAMGKSDVQFKKAATYYGFAMVYALKNDKGLALSFLRKGLDNGLGNLIKYQEIRSNKDLANVASSPEFEALLLEFEKPAPVQNTKKW